MHQYLEKFIDEIFNINYFINEDFIKNIFNDAINALYLDNLASELILSSMDNSFAFSLENKIFYNLKNIIYLSYKDSINYDLNKNDKIKFINLNALKILEHELEHIIQYKKTKEEDDNDEKIILNESIKHENYLKTNKMYNMKLYSVNPIERQANIISTYNIYNNIKDDNTLKKIFYDKYLIDCYYDYKFGIPIDIFFDNKTKFYELFFINDFDKRLELGLRI